MYCLEFYWDGNWVKLKNYSNLSIHKAQFLLYLCEAGQEVFQTKKEFRMIAQ
jgi:hypothetical protein